MSDEKGWAGIVRLVLELPLTYALVLAGVGVVVLTLVLSPLADRAGIAAQPPVVRLVLVTVSLVLIALGAGRAATQVQHRRAIAASARQAAEQAAAARHAQLAGFSPNERLLLGFYLMRGQRSLNINPAHPLAISLRGKGVLRLTGGSIDLLSCEYQLSDYMYIRLVEYFKSEPLTPAESEWLQSVEEYELHHRLDPAGIG